MWQAPYSSNQQQYGYNYQPIQPPQNNFPYQGQNSYNTQNSWQNQQHHQEHWYNICPNNQNNFGFHSGYPQQQQQQQQQQRHHPYNNYPRKHSFNSQKQIDKPHESVRCEPCDRDFSTRTALDAHQKMHVKCEENGCSFTASSKAVKLHFIQTHAEGKFRISLQTPEEIAKWREERKRNWPTVENVSRKKAKQMEDERDGILIRTKEFVYTDREHKGRGRGRHRGGIRERGRGRGGYQTGKKFNNVDMNNNKKNNSDISDTNATDVINSVASTDMSKDNALDSGKTTSGLSLLQSYGVDELSDDEGVVSKEDFSNVHPSVTETSTNIIQNLENMKKEMEDGELESEEESIKVKSFEKYNNKSHVSNEPTNCKQLHKAKTDRSNAKHKKGRNNKQSEVKKNTKVSLLEMLLAKEIRHERNVVLQCIRYIVKGNFFQS